jgi:peptide/nickel transport system ATP-binding protein
MTTASGSQAEMCQSASRCGTPSADQTSVRQELSDRGSSDVTTQGPPESASPLLEVSGLSIRIIEQRAGLNLVDDISFRVEQGEVLGLVGETGCGKTITGLSMMRLLPPSLRVVAGSIKFDGKEVLTMSEKGMRRIRGKDIAMIFQEPLTALNPVRTVGSQIAESLRLHLGLGRAAARRRAIELLTLVEMPAAERRYGQYPHQFSGGMAQRAMIAMALSCEPKLLIADEPTTALDVTTQSQIVELLQRLGRQLKMAVLFISHDLNLVRRVADRIIVMYAGTIVESGPVEAVFAASAHPYTSGLIGSIPTWDAACGRRRLVSIEGRPPTSAELDSGCRFAPRCPFAYERCSAKPALDQVAHEHRAACWRLADGHPAQPWVALQAAAPAPSASPYAGDPVVSVQNLCVDYALPGRRWSLVRSAPRLRAVDDISFDLYGGETVALVGESGCGKSTTARALLGVTPVSQGTVRVGDDEMRPGHGIRSREIYRIRQCVLQSPAASLDPRHSVATLITEPLRIQRTGGRESRRRTALKLLERVGLSPEMADRRPGQLSGGQKQRVAIARALSIEPSVVVFDEPLSALDVSVQAQIINLLRELQEQTSLTYLFIGHDLAVVGQLAHRIAVMYLGKIVEIGTTAQLLGTPRHPYTRALLASAPGVMTSAVVRGGDTAIGEVPSPTDPPSGCRFRTRCPRAQERCAAETPQLQVTDTGQMAACHFWFEPTGRSKCDA